MVTFFLAKASGIQQKKNKKRSKQRKDGLKLDDWNYLYHYKNCYADYTSSNKNARYIRKEKGEKQMPLMVAKNQINYEGNKLKNVIRNKFS